MKNYEERNTVDLRQPAQIERDGESARFRTGGEGAQSEPTIIGTSNGNQLEPSPMDEANRKNVRSIESGNAFSAGGSSETRDPDVGMNKFYNPNNVGLKNTPMLSGSDLQTEGIPVKSAKESNLTGYESEQISYLGKFISPSIIEEGHNTGKVRKVLHEYKTGKLHSGSKRGPKVRSRKQAVAIALSEARKAGENI